VETRYSSYSFSTSALDGGEWSASRPGRALAPGKGPQYPLYRRLGGPQIRSGHHANYLVQIHRLAQESYRPKDLLRVGSHIYSLFPVKARRDLDSILLLGFDLGFHRKGTTETSNDLNGHPSTLIRPTTTAIMQCTFLSLCLAKGKVGV
jgi:hypothetical protein